MKDKSTNQKSVKSFFRNLLSRLPRLDPLPKGLPVERDMRALALQTRLLIETLEQKDNTNRAVDVAAMVLQNYDLAASVNRPFEPMACRKNCSYCCYGFVSAMVPEILYIAAFIEQNHANRLNSLAEHAERLEENCRDIPPFDRYRHKTPCALLDGTLCSVHPARPLACRAIASMSLPECEETWHNKKETIPIPVAFISLRRQYENALRAALKHSNLDWNSYELTGAVRAVLKTKNAQERWLNGENIFEDVEIDPSMTNADNLKSMSLEMDFILGEMNRSKSSPKTV